jgi:flagellar basal body-associated protein FliL
MSKAGREELQAAVKKTLVDMLSESKVEEEQKLAKKVEAIYFTGFVLQ